MNAQGKFDTTSINHVANALMALTSKIKELPPEHQNTLLELTSQVAKRINTVFDIVIERDQSIMEVLETIRLNIKALDFNLWVTTKERDELKRRLEEG